MLHPQVRESTSLIDAEQQLVGVDGFAFPLETGHFGFAACQPANGALAACLGVSILGRILDAFIKSHGDGGAQVGLNLHALFRPHKDPMAVQMRGKSNALFGNLAELGQTEYLESTAVSQDRPIPAGEFVQPPQIGHQFVARPQMQMIGVAEHNLRSNLPQVMGGQTAFDGTGGGYILKSRGLNRAVNRAEFAAPGGMLLFQESKCGE